MAYLPITKKLRFRTEFEDQKMTVRANLNIFGEPMNTMNSMGNYVLRSIANPKREEETYKKNRGILGSNQHQ